MEKEIEVVSGIELVRAGAVPVSVSEMAEFGLGVASSALVDDEPLGEMGGARHG